LVVTRLSKSISGNLCMNCVRRYFWDFTLTTLFAGWWGVISFFRTLYLLPANVIEFLTARRVLRLLASDGNRTDVEEQLPR
jgi:hypothetical protein